MVIFEIPSVFEPKPTYGKCINRTSENLAVYGSKHPNDESTFEVSLYLLRDQQATPEGWDCDGFYLPNDRIANQLILPDVNGPAAVKYSDRLSLEALLNNINVFEITKTGIEYNCPGNLYIFTQNEMACPSTRIPFRVCWPIGNASHNQIQLG